MSEENNTPTQDQIREARHAGFSDSISHMPEDKRNQLTSSYQAQDARREANVSNFHGSVVGK